MLRYLIKFYYIGLDKYYGSQRQKNFLTIEDQILNALIRRKYIHNKENFGFEAASRTDRYVSARASTFSFLTEKKPILMEINSALPKEIGVWGFTEVPLDFSSRFNAQKRHYKYIFPYPLTHLNKKYNFNLDLMVKGLNKFLGKHNFQNFSKRDRENPKTIRTIEKIGYNLINDYIILDFKSKGFLRQQIRRMVKKLIELGKGLLSFKEFGKLFDPSEFHSYQPADPYGLILWNIEYDTKINFKYDEKSKKRMKQYFQSEFFTHDQKAQLFRILKHNNFGE